MDAVLWNESLLIGVVEIDAQHHELIDIRNRLAACCTSAVDSDFEAFHKILSELFEYTRTHFQAEEEFMQTIGFPGLAEQQKQHGQFIDAIMKLSVAASKGIDVQAQGVTFLTKWLLSHICLSDMEIRYFLDERQD